jgi:hypothetical protein
MVRSGQDTGSSSWNDIISRVCQIVVVSSWAVVNACFCASLAGCSSARNRRLASMLARDAE